MFNWLRSKTKHAGDKLLALDIGTEFVKGILIQANGDRGRILGSSKIRQGITDMHNGIITDIAAVIRSCTLALSEAQRVAGVSADQLLIGIGGELIKGATRTLRYRRHEPTAKIHLEELKHIIHKVQWKAFEQIRAEVAAETGYNEIDVKLIGASIIDLRVDNHKVANPIGFQGKEVLINVLNTFSPLIHYGVIQTIAAELNRDVVGIMAEPYALTRALTYPSDESADAIFMDIGGGTTDIAVMRDGLLEGTKMFTLGGRTFTKRLAQHLNVSSSEAEEIKLAYSGNRLEKQSHKIVSHALKNDCEVWLTGVTMTLSEFSQVDSFPAQIFLCGGGSLLPEIKLLLAESDWWKNLPFVRQPQIGFLHPKDIQGLDDATNTLHEPQDVTPMALAHLGLESLHEEKILNQILRKAVRLMQI